MPVMESRKARRLATAVAALALGSALTVAAPVAASAAANVDRQSFTIEVDFQTTNFCGDEPELVTVSETLHFNTTTVTDAAGQRHVTETTIATGEGEGSLGNQYSLSRQSHITQMSAGDFAPVVQDVVHHFRLVGQGSAPSIVITQTIRFTINANKELTASVSNISSECVEP
jgi:hypothetical protein